MKFRNTAILLIILTLMILPFITFSRKSSKIPTHTSIIPETQTVNFFRTGYFKMGAQNGFDNEYPEHLVKVKPFAIDKYEITNYQYCVFLNKIKEDVTNINDYIHLDHPSSLIILRNGRYNVNQKFKNHPVVNVTWYGANAFCTNKEIKKRLPTEAEWEYAASNRGKKRYSFGNEWNPNKCNHSSFDMRQFLDLVAPLKNNRGTLPVGTLPQEVSGTYDMAGNVMEWVQDKYYPNYVHHNVYGKNSLKISKTKERTVRGGGWFYLRNNNYRVTARTGFSPDFYADYVGFRCAE